MCMPALGDHIEVEIHEFENNCRVSQVCNKTAMVSKLDMLDMASYILMCLREDSVYSLVFV